MKLLLLELHFPFGSIIVPATQLLKICTENLCHKLRLRWKGMMTVWKKVWFQEKKTYSKRIFICLGMGNYEFILNSYIFLITVFMPPNWLKLMPGLDSKTVQIFTNKPFSNFQLNKATEAAILFLLLATPFYSHNVHISVKITHQKTPNYQLQKKSRDIKFRLFTKTFFIFESNWHFQILSNFFFSIVS